MTPTPRLTALESMSANELLEVIRLQNAIDAAKKAGLDGWECSLRETLANLMRGKSRIR